MSIVTGVDTEIGDICKGIVKKLGIGHWALGIGHLEKNIYFINSKLKTQNSKLKTQNSKLPVPHIANNALPYAASVWTEDSTGTFKYR
jgi:hypothetical protein